MLILRDALGFSGAEVAEALETTPASVYSALQRAHDSVDHRLPNVSQQATLRTLGDEKLREIVDRYTAAWEQNDIDEITAMLTDRATLAMPPTATWYRGRDAIATGLKTGPLNGVLRWRMVPTYANGQPAAKTYRWDDSEGRFVSHPILAVLTLRGDRIEAIDAFHDPSLPVPFW